MGRTPRRSSSCAARPRARATPILFKLAWATYHAYNGTGYGSLYAEAVWAGGGGKPGFTVTTRRPGGGTGGIVMYGDAPDAYDPTSRRQTFTHWEAPFVQWLEANGYRVGLRDRLGPPGRPRDSSRPTR